MNDFDFMGLALAQAQQAAVAGEVPIGAVLVFDGEVIAQAHNLRETDQDATAHAEMLVVREACRKLGRWRLSGTTMFVTIEPCPMCAGAIIQSRMKNVYFGAKDIKSGCAGSKTDLFRKNLFNHNVEIKGGILEEECGALLKNFFQERR